MSGATTLLEKYRPKSLNEIYGQEKTITIIRQLMCENFPHILLSGPPGTGKTTLALAIARQFYGNNFRSNVLELNASDERGISVVREKIKIFAMRPVMTEKTDIHFKLIILDEADCMTKDAQNALRRIIENESKSTRFIFICNYLTKLSSAIISRCSLFKFFPIEKSKIKERLIFIANEEIKSLGKSEEIGNSFRALLSSSENNENEQKNIEEKFIDEIIKQSKGDLRKAVGLLEEAFLNESFDSKETFKKYFFENYEIVKDNEELKKLVKNLINLSFQKNFREIYGEIVKYEKSGKAFQNLLINILDEILLCDKINNNIKSSLIIELSKVEFKISIGADRKLLMLKFFSFLICSV